MLPSYQRFNASSSGKIRSFRASEKILVFLVFISFLVIVLFGFFLLPDFGGTNGVIQAYNKFKKAGPEIFIPAPPIADKNRETNDFDRIRLQEKIKSDLDVNWLEKPEILQPAKVPIAPIPVPDHKKNHNKHHDDKTTHNSGDSLYVADGVDQDPTARERRDKVKEVSFQTEPKISRLLNLKSESAQLQIRINSINGSSAWIVSCRLIGSSMRLLFPRPLHFANSSFIPQFNWLIRLSDMSSFGG